MIELYSQHYLVADGARQVTLDLDSVGREVADSCVAAGLRESWLAEQMQLALEDFFAARRQVGAPPPARSEIDGLLVRLLSAAGYADAAAEFARRRQVAAPPAPGLPARPVGPWLLPADFWQDAFAGPLREACAARLLHPCPVSRLFPVSRVILDLARVATRLGDPPVLELAWWPALDRLARLLPAALCAMQRAVRRQGIPAADATAAVWLTGFAGLTRNALAPLSRPDARRLAAEVPAAVQRRVAGAVTFPVRVLLRTP